MPIRRGGSIKHIAILSDPAVISLKTDETARVTLNTNQGSGTIWMICDPNTSEPTPTQIRAGLEQAGGAADFDTSITPQVKISYMDITGLTAATQYDCWIVQTNEMGDSNVSNVQFTTEA